LVFHTGRVVGTGCAGQMEARLSILRAQRQLAQEAGLQLHFRKFAVINQVAAVSLGARLSCDQFANAHSATSHYDRQSFVGLAWRPVGEPICCEICDAIPSNSPLAHVRSRHWCFRTQTPPAGRISQARRASATC